MFAEHLYVLMVLAGFGAFAATLGFISVWSKGGARRPQTSVVQATRPAAGDDATEHRRVA